MEYLPLNDLFYIQRDSHLSVYADDHQLYNAHKDPVQAVMVIKDKRRDGKVRISYREIHANIKQ